MNDEERNIRAGLAEKLGTEFFEPDDEAINQKVDEPIKMITIGELIDMINAAIDRTDKSDPNKLLLLNCGNVINQLLSRLAMYGPPKVN